MVCYTVNFTITFTIWQIHSFHFILSRSKCIQSRTLTSTETSQSLTTLSLVFYNLQFYTVLRGISAKKNLSWRIPVIVYRDRWKNSHGWWVRLSFFFFAYPQAPLQYVKQYKQWLLHKMATWLSLPVQHDVGLSQSMLRPCILTPWQDIKV